MTLALYREIYNLVDAHPGCKPAEIARMMNVHRSSITRILPQLEYNGFLLSEGEIGNLFTYRIILRFPEDLHDEGVHRITRWRRLKRKVL